MFDVFHALGTLPSRRDKLKSSMISINEFLEIIIKYNNVIRKPGREYLEKGAFKLEGIQRTI
ncbi:hypothetical protein BpHYR1_031340 [Brachionus plicatilis]|uniref:Uncharacterized protein n=1 Tax=Brachionus plicatilis TaxID=10195 RepID=A0A3M7SD70_BRAPC|nr:hypothetical protein BpHYR1_031340 [Brachionus plicatilis]